MIGIVTRSAPANSVSWTAVQTGIGIGLFAVLVTGCSMEAASVPYNGSGRRGIQTMTPEQVAET
ncbi:MAG: hypothetical protein QF391_10175, partial [Myxococcota bacterium]|nr:hypothetical protein [Myxococcota bacterium]